jgi:hypothetical protein
MLYFIFEISQLKPRFRVKNEKVAWQIGDKFPRNTEDYPCIEVQANGDELGFVIKSFNNLPHAIGVMRVQKWRGEFAQFIYGNLQGRRDVI